jgi:hypothetical protein
MLRPSGRLLEPRSDSGPRGMIIALPSEKSRCKSGFTDVRRTESGLQAHPLFFNNLQTVLAKLWHNCDTVFRFLFAQALIHIHPMSCPFVGIEFYEWLAGMSTWCRTRQSKICLADGAVVAPPASQTAKYGPSHNRRLHSSSGWRTNDRCCGQHF